MKTNLVAAELPVWENKVEFERDTKGWQADYMVSAKWKFL